MPFRTVHGSPDKGDKYALEYEFITLTVRIYKDDNRIASFTVTSSGVASARITDLTLVHPHQFTKALFETIRAWLVRMGYAHVSYERQIKKGQFVSKEFKL